MRNTPTHDWPATYAALFTDPLGGPVTPETVDLIPPGPQCPSGTMTGDQDYTITDNGDGTITITCSSGSTDVAYHNTPTGFTPGVSAE